MSSSRRIPTGIVVSLIAAVVALGLNAGLTYWSVGRSTSDLGWIAGATISLQLLSTALVLLGCVWLYRWASPNSPAGKKQLREQDLFRTTLASIGDAVIATDAEGKVTFLNAVAETLTGWSAADAKYQHLTSVFRIVNEATREPVENPALRALRDGAIVGLANHTVLIAKDGSELPIDDSAAPIRDDSGMITGSILVFRDFTKRKQIEIALHERARLTSMRAEVNSALASTQAQTLVLRLCCESLVDQLKMAFARIWTLNSAGDTLILQASAGIYTHLDGPHRSIPVGQFKIGRIAAAGLPHLTNSVLDDPNVSDHAWAAREGMVAFAGYPLKIEGRVVGVVAMFSRRPLSDGVLSDLAPLAEDIAQFIERRKTEEALRESDQFNRSLMDGSPDCVKVLDLEGRLQHMNAPGLCVMEIDDFAPFCGREWQTLWPDDMVSEIQTSLAQARSGESYSFQAQCPTAKGSPRWWEVTVSPVRNAEGGKIVRLLAISRDITGRRKAEEALRFAGEQFRTMTENISQLAWTADAKGYIYWYNRRWFDYTGTTLEQMQGWGWRDVHHPDHVDRVVERIQKSWDTGEPWEDEFPLRSATGEYRWFLSRALPIRDDAGNVARWFGTNTDVTEQRLAAEVLRQNAADMSEADRRKNEFLATLAHELRNPLAPIRNGVQLLRYAGDDKPTSDEVLTMMERQLGQMVRLVDDLMDVSRISQGKLELRPERMDIAPAVNSAIETSRSLIDGMGHELVVAMPAAPIMVHADLTRLAQVFMNLLNNAAKYSERGGRIQLSVERDGSDVVVAVRDSGIGIAVDQLPRIFELFAQVDHSLEKAQGGLGIGLSLVKRLVEMHGGTIQARSEGRGRGSEFVVRLPIAVESNEPQSLKPKAPIAESSKLKILVVDDNRDGADSLALMLRAMGNETRTAYDGEQAVHASGEMRPDVILLDIGLPKLNGHEACVRIRRQPGGEKMLIIAQTGWGQDQDRRRTQDSGFDHHLVKPVDPTVLMRLLAERPRS